MLSDEEKQAMESLIEIREFANLSNYKDTKISQLNAIDIVLNLIEKQSKEIEELKEDKYGLEEEVQMQAKNIMLCESALCEIQDKIKAKIEEIEEILNGQLIEKLRVYFEAQKEILQSLLEKE